MALDLLAEISRCSVPKMKAVNQDYSPMQYIISNRVKEYVANNLDKAIQLADIAKEIHKTPNYLNYIFKKVNGITIKQYINREKISKVIQLGTNYNMSLKDAGEYVGLHDQNYLSRLFKKVTSLSFTDYINNLGILPPVTTEND
jgi:two-component system response regulator YesN